MWIVEKHSPCLKPVYSDYDCIDIESINQFGKYRHL